MKDNDLISHANCLYILYDSNISATITDRFSEVKYSALRAGIPYQEVEMTSYDTLASTFASIKMKAKKGAKPVIHFECHGNDQGLLIGDGSTLTYDRLAPCLTEINIACENNLWCTFAACHSATIHSGIIECIFREFDEMPRGAVRSPVFMLIAPITELSEEDTSLFIPLLLEFTNIEPSFKIDGAIDSLLRLNGYSAFGTITCDKVCRDLCREFLNSLASTVFKDDATFEDNLRRRLVDIFDGHNNVRMPNGDIRTLKSQLTSRFWYDSMYVRLQEWFYMLDLYPDNADRYNVAQQIPDWDTLTHNVKHLITNN